MAPRWPVRGKTRRQLQCSHATFATIQIGDNSPGTAMVPAMSAADPVASPARASVLPGRVVAVTDTRHCQALAERTYRQLLSGAGMS